MPADVNKATTQRVYDSINAGKIDILDEVLADGFIEHDEVPGFPPNKEGVRQFFSMARTAFPDFTMRIEDMIAEGEKVFVHARMQGTQRGEFMGIPASGKRISVPMVDILRFEDGKVVEHWGVTDTGAMMQQLQG